MNNCGGGGGARTFADGIDTGGIFHSMGSMIPNVETMESRTAELVLYRRQRADSAGHGRFRGGAGIELAMTPHKNPEPVIHVTISAFASQPDNQGLSGGTPAAVNYNVLLRGSDVQGRFGAGCLPVRPEELACERFEVVPAKAHSLVGAGDVHVYLQTGGGGYGDPLRRDPAAVVDDVAGGLVSEAVALEVYGVVIGDAEGTERAREAIRRERLAEARPADPGFTSHGRAAGGELMHRVADSLEAVRVDGAAVICCSLCRRRLSGYDEDYKRGTVMRERSFFSLSPLNAVAPATDLVAREFYCPGCGTALALDIQRAGEPLLPECTFFPIGEAPMAGELLDRAAVRELEWPCEGSPADPGA
jgi:N-methylhydantoinase B